MTWFRVGGAGIPATLKNAMNAVFNKKFGTSGQNYPPKQWPDDVNLLGPLPEKMVAGLIAHTDDAADTVPVKSVICSIVPKRAGSGTPSPTNPRAISGYTGLTISQRGKNLLDSSTGTGTGTIWFYYDNGFLFRKGVTYTFSVVVPVTTGSIAIYGTDHNTQIAYAYISATSSKLTFTPTDDVLGCPRIYSSGLQLSDVSDAMIEIGSSQTTYEAYNAAADISDNWSSIGAIYGGNRNLSTGGLEQTWHRVKISELSFVKDSNCQHTFRCGGMLSPYNRKYGNGNFNIQADIFDTYTLQNSTGSNISTLETGNDFHIFVNGGSNTFYISCDSTYDNKTAADFMTDFGDYYLYYELSTPIDYSGLDIYDFETLYAVNNFYSNIEGGQTQVTYRQDIDLALQAVSSSRGLMMASRPVTQLIGEQADLDQVNELNEEVENTEEQEGEDDAR